MRRYRSGHNEAVLKTVWGRPHVGSNPTLRAINNDEFLEFICDYYPAHINFIELFNQFKENKNEN